MSVTKKTKVNLKDISSVLKELSFELPIDRTLKEEEKVILDLSKKVKLKGFRPGKVPVNVIRGRFKKDVEEQIAETMVNSEVEGFLKESDLKPIAPPRMKEINYDLGKALSFVVEFEVNPEFEVQEYDKIKISQNKIKVSGKEIDQEIENLRQRVAELLPVEDRAIKEGDVVTLGGFYEYGHDDHSHRSEMKRHSYPVPDKKNDFSAFDKEVAGLKKGEEKKFEVKIENEKFGKNLEGKDVKFDLKIEDIHTVKLPDVDDEFARSLGEFENLKVVKDELKKSLMEMKKEEERKRISNEMFDLLREKNEFEIPNVHIDRETENVLYSTASRMVNMGINLRHNPIDWEKMRYEVRPEAKVNVTKMMIVLKLAEQQNIEVTDDEVMEKIKEYAKSEKTNPEKMKADMQKDGEYSRLETDLLYGKVVDFLFNINHINIE